MVSNRCGGCPLGSESTRGDIDRNSVRDVGGTFSRSISERVGLELMLFDL